MLEVLLQCEHDAEVMTTSCPSQSCDFATLRIVFSEKQPSRSHQQPKKTIMTTRATLLATNTMRRTQQKLVARMLSSSSLAATQRSTVSILSSKTSSLNINFRSYHHSTSFPPPPPPPKMAVDADERFCAWIFLGALLAANAFVVYVEVNDSKNGFFRNNVKNTTSSIDEEKTQDKTRSIQEQLEKKRVGISELFTLDLNPTKTLHIQWCAK